MCRLKALRAAVCAVVLLSIYSAIASAALVVTGTVFYAGADRKLIYDDYRNITWLDFTDAAKTWSDQMSWAQNLSITIDTVSYEDWRLPSALDSNGNPIVQIPDFPAEDTVSDMGHLYFSELGNGYNQWLNNINHPEAFAPFNYGPFSNLGNINGYIAPYWTSTDYPEAGSLVGSKAYYFDMGGGWLNADWKSGLSSSFKPGIAVHEGIISAVPIPAAIWLLGSALGLLGSMRRKGA